MKAYIKNKIKDLIGKSPEKRIKSLKDRGMKIGENFKMLGECIIDPSHFWHIEIGSDVTLAPRVHLLAHDASTKVFLNYTKIKNVKIGNKVFIGASSIIMPGVVLGDNVIIGAGSIVTKNVPSNSVFAGNPAKFICTTDEYIDKQSIEMSNSPLFGQEYTVDGGINLSMRNDMKNLVEERGVGYVI
jgi:maltose O-acetyltransferase